jgi:hypothetical protein
LLQALKKGGALGKCLPAAYRTPRLTQEQALEIATTAIQVRKQEYDPEGELYPITYMGEWDGAFFLFRSATTRLVKEAHEGGGLYAHVDKVDGHLWTPLEMRFFNLSSGIVW